VLDYILLLYLITGSQHNGDILPENYKKVVAYSVCVTLLTFIRMFSFQNLLRPERIRRWVGACQTSFLPRSLLESWLFLRSKGSKHSRMFTWTLRDLHSRGATHDHVYTNT